MYGKLSFLRCESQSTLPVASTIFFDIKNFKMHPQYVLQQRLPEPLPVLRLYVHLPVLS